MRLKLGEMWRKDGLLQIFGKKCISGTEDVVPQRKEHESQHRRKAKGHHDTKRFVTRRFSSYGLIGVKHQMPSVERWNREKVQKANRSAENSNEPYKALRTLAGHGTRSLRNADGSAEVARADRPGDHMRQT